ncbi:MAG: hypothetical protein JWM32_193 [Verrucomicrobia bacterium]|nr:hypothetical protein [Verrucomicrobiota bacterium]
MTSCCHVRRFHFAFLASWRFLALGAIGLLPLAARATPVAFDLPAQPAPAALQLFIQQSGAEVLFLHDELASVRSHAVKGDMEPLEALKKLLEGTGFEVTQKAPNAFVVKQADIPKTTGTVRGNLAKESGAPAEGVRVVIRETGQQARTDRNGEFAFASVGPGTYLLVVSAEGYQPLHITDVVVRANRELTLGKEELRPANGTLSLEPYVVHAETVTQLESFEVNDSKVKPYAAGNMDVPRTIDDVQPYYIFNAKTIDQSGATNVEDFLKQRLTMNTAALTNSQRAIGNSFGNTSSINLRGLGTDKTLILVNGRRAAGVSNRGVDGQPDLNGIPLASIERIEVMPSSAAGIYGGSALGGVINVILKKDYVGGEIRLGYDNTFDTDAARRTASINYGLALEGGKTHVTLGASWSDANDLLAQDRLGAILAARATIQRNLPSFFATANVPILGASPNIGPTSATQTTLTLKNGVVLPSNRTFISPGTPADISRADLYAMLIRNAGAWNFDLAPTAQEPGLLLPFDSPAKVRSLSASVHRQMWARVEAFADFSWNENSTRQVSTLIGTGALVPSTSAASPFTTDVNVTFPALLSVPYTSRSVSRSLTLGAIAQLPWSWTGEFDYTWTKNVLNTTLVSLDTTATFADRNSGAINPFNDTVQFLDLSKYVITSPFQGVTDLDDFALRGSGPLFHLPWGVPTLTVGLEHRLTKVPTSIYDSRSPIATTTSFRFRYFERDSTTDSGYAELLVPVVKKDWVPLVHAFDLQFAGRREVYTADTGTFTVRENYGLPTPTYIYTGVTRNGAPFFSQTTFSSSDYTAGFKYQPLPEVTFRASRGTAFLPPTPTQLSPNNNPSTTTTNVFDPATGNTVAVTTVPGGNPGLTPQHSKSTNAGVIWEPTWKVVKGLRLNVEYYKIEQFDAIAVLSAAQIVGAGSVYADRITRDANGKITQVNISNLNLYKLVTEGWDLSGDYTLKTDVGTFNLGAVGSIIEHLKTQFSATQPEYEAAGYNPAENGAPKYKSNVRLTWEARHWSAGWALRYFGSYKVYGAVGGPSSRQNANGGVFSNYIAAQGGDTVSSQMYHDLFAGYTFGRVTEHRFKGETLFDGLAVQVGVRNIFDKVPPLDLNNLGTSTFYLSPFGDMRLRSYWLSVRKAF